MNATTFLRPIHTWFFFWERVIPSLYRVVATALAALITAFILIVIGVHPLAAIPVSLIGWIGLAVVQEHDGRVVLPPDHSFVAALEAAVGSPHLGLTIENARGPNRARSQTWDTLVVLSRQAVDDHPLASMFISVKRNEAEGWMRLIVMDDAPGQYKSIEERLRDQDQLSLAERIQQAQSPDDDARAIAAALIAAY